VRVLRLPRAYCRLCIRTTSVLGRRVTEEDGREKEGREGDSGRDGGARGVLGVDRAGGVDVVIVLLMWVFLGDCEVRGREGQWDM